MKRLKEVPNNGLKNVRVLCMWVLLVELQKLLKKDKENNYGFIFHNVRLIK